GGLPFFKKEGITWQLISSSIKARYLPTGYILDNSSPIIVLKDDIKQRELFFILGWLLTLKANELLKNVLNHTKNIQSKDIERLPYPSWVSEEDKTKAIEYIQNNIKKIYKDVKLDDNFSEILEDFYKMK
ncbi:BREX-1 system adenine-specific DNA-methyltransferase PglX, partial [bacterium]|nr:BREX-1 system adenine-specific DNA-methyltransferase PglX [bacterium]